MVIPPLPCGYMYMDSSNLHVAGDIPLISTAFELTYLFPMPSFSLPRVNSGIPASEGWPSHWDLNSSTVFLTLIIPSVSNFACSRYLVFSMMLRPYFPDVTKSSVRGVRFSRLLLDVVTS